MIRLFPLVALALLGCTPEEESKDGPPIYTGTDTGEENCA